MALLASLQRFSRRQYALSLLVLTLFLFIIGQAKVLPVLFVLFLPALLFARWVLRQQHHHGVTDRELEQLFRMFLGGGFVIITLAFVAQMLLAPLLAFLCFYDQRDTIKEQLEGEFDSSDGSRAAPAHGPRLAKLLMQLKLDKTVGYYLFMLALAFIVAALVEEFLKFWMVQGACCCCGSSRRGCCRGLSCCGRKSTASPAFTAIKRRQSTPYHGALRGGLCHPSRLLFFHRPHANHPFVAFLAVISAALGFSVMENTVYSLVAPTFSDMMATAALRTISSTPLHCICGGLTGVRLAERLLAHRQGGSEERGTNAAKADLSRVRTKLAVIFPAVLIHGTFDAQLFLIMTLVSEEMQAAHPTRYGIVLPTVLTAVVLVASFVYFRRKLHAMENKMNETRYIHVAVDLESGEGLGAVNGGFDDDFFGNEEDNSDSEDDSFVRGNRKVRAVFDM